MSRIFNPKVFQLGYVGLGCTDLEKTTAHYLNNLGLSETAKGPRRRDLSLGWIRASQHHPQENRPEVAAEPWLPTQAEHRDRELCEGAS
jgi:hypothetical protein